MSQLLCIDKYTVIFLNHRVDLKSVLDQGIVYEWLFKWFK